MLEYLVKRDKTTILAKSDEIAHNVLFLLDQQIPCSSRRLSGEAASSQG